MEFFCAWALYQVAFPGAQKRGTWGTQPFWLIRLGVPKAHGCNI